MRQCIPITLTPQDTARFWAKVDKSGECWLWQASTDECGYGQMNIAGRLTRAHRIAWTIMRGPIPDGLYVCHNCPGGDDPRCVNPAHLFLGTAKENSRDMVAKGRHVVVGKRTTGRCGEDHHGAKLTAQRVREIRAASAEGVSGCALSRQYGVSERTIRDVLKKRYWTHVA
jgi:hypothetical protein